MTELLDWGQSFRQITFSYEIGFSHTDRDAGADQNPTDSGERFEEMAAIDAEIDAVRTAQQLKKVG